MVRIPQENLLNLRTYKYSSVDHSIMGRLVMQSYWNFMLQFVPLWAHPNLVTLAGFFVLIASVLPLAVNVVWYGVDAPWWGWILFAIGTFMYQTLDALDGKQARRLGVGSSLGEMVDHGCDAVSTTIVQFAVACCVCIPRSDGSEFPIPPHVQTALCSSMVVMCFYLAMWDQQRTGQFTMGYINGPTEGLLVSCVMFALRGLLSPLVFSTPVLPIVGWTIAEGFFVFTCMVSVCTATSNIINVASKCSWRETTSILPMVLLLVLVNDATMSLPEIFAAPSASGNNDIRFKPVYHFVVCFAFGIVCASAGTRLTIQRLTKLRFRHTHVIGYVMLLCTLALLLSTLRVMGVDAVISPSSWWPCMLVLCAVVSAVEYAHLVVLTWRAFGKFLRVKFITL